MEEKESKASFRNTSFKDVGRPSLAALDDIDFLGRESLGILPTSLLGRDSLTADFLLDKSPRDSLGILNISQMDLGRESLGIFNLSFKNDTIVTNCPRINISADRGADKTTLSSIPELDRGFLSAHSRAVSSNSSENPVFNSRSFEDPSKIFDCSVPLKDFSMDPLNQAFQISQGKHLRSCQNSMLLFSSPKMRIKSLPTSLDNVILGKPKRMSDEDFVSRGLEDNLNDSVFLRCTEESFDNVRYILDLTPQPNWDEFDSSKSPPMEKSPYNKEKVSQMVDKMLNMLPVNLEENLNKKETAQSFNNSKMSRASQCDICDCGSQNVSKASIENVSKLLQDLSGIIQEQDNLSKTQKSEGQHHLTRLSDLLCASLGEQVNSEDSGHSSVDEPQSEAKVELEEEEKALDTSVKSQNAVQKSSVTKQPPPYVNSPVKSIKGIPKTPVVKSSSTPSITAIKRQSNISHNRVSHVTSKPKSQVISKKEPLRAVLPVETMAKGVATVTPEKKKLGLVSKKTSTPLHEARLKPMATSTPSMDKDSQNAGQPKLIRSFSYQPKLEQKSSSMRKSLDIGTGRVRKSSLGETAPKPEGIKRSNSVGRDSKITLKKPPTILGARKASLDSNVVNKISQTKIKLGKENLRP